jgi:hypothetical protein
MVKYFFRLLTAILVATLGIGGGLGMLVFIIFLAGKGDQHASQYGLTVGLGVGLVSAAVTIFIMMPLDLLFRWSVAKGAGKNETTAILENEQRRELILYGPAKKIHFACRQSLLSIPGVKDVFDDSTHGRITATTGASWRCPGEMIEVEIKRLTGEEFLLKCVSRPAMSKVAFDYGKNFENVEYWKKRTQEFMKLGNNYG